MDELEKDELEDVVYRHVNEFISTYKNISSTDFEKANTDMEAYNFMRNMEKYGIDFDKLCRYYDESKK